MNTLDAIKGADAGEMASFLSSITENTITDTVCGEKCPFHSICGSYPLCQDIDQIKFQALVFLTIQSNETMGDLMEGIQK